MTTVFTPEELAKHDGTNASAPIYVAIKGTVFDVSSKKEMYGPGAGYHCFAGKDASKVISHSFTLHAHPMPIDTSDAMTFFFCKSDRVY